MPAKPLADLELDKPCMGTVGKGARLELTWNVRGQTFWSGR
jgi:hypothetical protein